MGRDAGPGLGFRGGRPPARVLVRPGAPQVASAAGAPSPVAALSPASTEEILVVVSKLKAYICERSEINTSADVMEILSDKLRALCDEAIRRARADGRKTVMTRDFRDSRGDKALMKQRFLRVALGSLFGLFSFVASGFAGPQPKAVADHVIIVSIDGGKPTVLQQSRMPILLEWAKRGATSWEARTVFPSLTLPSHVSMLSGVGPERHGITWNDWQPNRGPVRVPTVFSLARERGVRVSFIAGKNKLLHLNVPGALDHFRLVEGGDAAVATEAASEFERNQPALMFVHFPDVDGAGHVFGWGSPRQKDAAARADSALRRVYESVERAGRRDRTLFVVTADHGGQGMTHGSRSDADMTIPWIAFGAGVRAGAKLPTGLRTLDTAATALWALGLWSPEPRAPGAMDGRPVLDAFL